MSTLTHLSSLLSGIVSQPSIAPAPTMPPVSGPQYLVAGGPFTSSPESGLGASVSMLGASAVAGSPGTSLGSVLTYQRTQGEWRQLDQVLEGPHEGSSFGASVALSSAGMVVGAPGARASGEAATATGAAYYYQFDRTSSTWTQNGEALRGTEDMDAEKEEFGYAVSMSGSDTRRIVVGAPQRLSGDGGVYTFESSDGGGWTAMTTAPIVEAGSQEQLGSSVDVSSDGKRIVVGGPGAQNGQGRFAIYQWNVAAMEWLQLANLSGSDDQRLGSSVAFISPLGDIVAVGAPGASPGGLIRVFQRVPDSLAFEQKGPDIVGNNGDRLGATGTVQGSSREGNIEIVAGTSSGLVRRFEYDEQRDTWFQPISDIVTEPSGAVTSVYASNGTGSVITGISELESVTMYMFTAPPTPPPATEPVAPVATPSVPAPAAEPSVSAPVTPSWEASGDPFVGPSSTDNLGTSVTLAQSAMAAGSTSSGFVNTYELVNGNWEFVETIPEVESGSSFGVSVDLNPSGDGLLVGAPQTPADGMSAATGAAHYFTKFGGSAWSQRGATIHGDTTAFTVNEEFGYAVAASSDNIVAIGAPKNNEESIMGRGRVYVLTYDSNWNSWIPYGFGADALRGDEDGANLGTSVDISPDASTLIAGAPGQNSGAGAVYLYQYLQTADEGEASGGAGEDESTGEWVRLPSFVEATLDESLGLSVAVVSDNGSVVAAGGPNYDGGKGVIRAFQRQDSTSTYEPLGEPIIGDVDDKLGLPGTISGSTTTTTTILASTATGQVKTFSYNAITNTWDQAIPAVLVVPESATSDSSDLSSNVLSGSLKNGHFAAGGNNKVQVYTFAVK